VYYRAPKGASVRDIKPKYKYAPILNERSSGLSRREQAWLNLACKLAETSQERTKHGCLIVAGGAPQAMGVNTKRNQPGIIEDIDALSVHAEINALRRVKNLRNATAYIARVNNNGDKRQSRPCPDCLNSLKAAGVKKIIYTINGSEYL
jgi:tRNA(Arg) A34 adenosine deaminase TadA